MLSTLFIPVFAVRLASALAVVAAPPEVDVAPRQIDTLCGQYESVTAADFTLNTNLWGESSATSGSQCAYLDWDSGDAVSWQTSWTWEGGGSDVKSYTNAGLTMDSTRLSSITSMPTTWSWSYTGSDIVADVSYDAFITSTDSTDVTASYEVMIWLAALGGAGPISSTGYTPIATPTIGGVTWNLFKGPNTWTVFSFVASSEQTDFSGDVMDFFNYLIDNQGMPSDYYLESIAAGTEAFTGSDALFTVSPFSLSLDT